MQRYILTDAGNVLTRFKFRKVLVEEIMASFGVKDVRVTEIFSTQDGALASDESYYNGLDTGQFSLYDIWERLMKQYPSVRQVCEYPLFLSLWCRHLEPIKEVVGLYRQLQKNFPLVVVSNGESEGVRHLVHHLVGSYGLTFEEIFISAEHKLKKPELLGDVVAFLHNKGIAPPDCVFVDDLLPYVQAARGLNIPSIQFDGSRQSAQELKEALAMMGFS